MQHYEGITENDFDLAGNPGSKGGDNSPSPLPRARNTGSNFFGLVSQWQARSRVRSPRQPNAGSIPVQSSSLCPGRFSKGFLFTFPLGEGPTRTVPRRLSTSGAGAVSFPWIARLLPRLRSIALAGNAQRLSGGAFEYCLSDVRPGRCTGYGGFVTSDKVGKRAQLCRRIRFDSGRQYSFFRVPIACVEGVRSQAEYEGSPLGNDLSSTTVLFNTSSQPGAYFWEKNPGAGNLSVEDSL